MRTSKISFFKYIFSILIFSTFLLCQLILATNSSAQSAEGYSITRKRYQFKEDVSKIKKAKANRRTNILKKDKSKKDQLDIKAPSIKYNRDGSTANATGGVVVSGNGVQIEADNVTINTETKDSILDGNVIFTGQSAKIAATKANVNVSDETGEFQNGDFLYEDGGYEIKANQLFKLSETRYKLIDSKMSTCDCDSMEDCPWYIQSSQGEVTQNGYAKLKDASIWFHGVPVFYSPYLIMPAKNERAAGLMAPHVGYSNRNGYEYEQPIFIPLSESADFHISPFVQTKTRYGASSQVKKIFSEENKLEGKFLYSDESQRKGDLRGTRVADLVSDKIDTNRTGVYFNQIYRADESALVPIRLISDIHYTSDDTMVKEIQDPDLADPTSRVNTSKVTARSAIGQYLNADITAENNDLIFGRTGEDKFTFNRLPETSLSFLKSFRPIDNPYGLRLVSKINLTETEFSRDKGYEGSRTVLQPEGDIPFHLGNYFAGMLGAGAYIRNYSLSNRDVYDLSNSTSVSDARISSQLPDPNNSQVPYFQAKIGTALERVFSVDDDSFLTKITSLGRDNQDTKLVRFKNVIEPSVKYLYIPDISQNNDPQFDQLDRINERGLVTYGISTSILGRFNPRSDVATGIAELTPEISDFPAFDTLNPLPTFGQAMNPGNVTGGMQIQQKRVSEIVSLSVEQGYDFKKATRRDQEIAAKRTSTILPTTDLSTTLTLTPNQNFGGQFTTYFNTDQNRFTGLALQSKLSSDRGDSIFARYSFVGAPVTDPTAADQLDQIDGGFEAVITDRSRFGIYTQWDSLKHEILNNRFALRLYSSCNCWSVDLGYVDSINPDNQTYYVSFALTGLGDFSQDIWKVRNTNTTGN